MFEYIRSKYNGIRESYQRRLYSRRWGFFSFFAAFFHYIFGRRYEETHSERRQTLSKENQSRFRNSLNTEFASNYDTSFGPGEITFKEKDLTSKL